jgi:multidrug resistance protein, MATE family
MVAKASNPTCNALRPLTTELKQTLRLALPIVGSQLLFMSMGTVDTIFAGHHGPETLAAVALGTNIFFLGFVTLSGLFLALAARLSALRGAGASPETLGQQLCGALGLATVLGLVWMAVSLLSAELIVSKLGVSAVVQDGAARYLFIVSLACVPLCWTFALRNMAEALQRPRIPLLIGLIGLLVNVVADASLIYGRWGLPEMGSDGAAWASLLSVLTMLAAYVTAYGRLQVLRGLKVMVQMRRHVWTGSVALLKLGVPVALILTAEAWLFQVGALFIAQFGDTAIAAHQIAINFAAMAFMVPLSIGMAATVRVGDALGRGDLVAAARAGNAGIVIAIGFALLSAALMWAVPGMIIGLYTGDPNISALAVSFLGFAALFQLFDGIQASANGALRGRQDTRIPMIITVIAYWGIAMPTAVWLAFSKGLGPSGIWIGFIVGLVVAATGLTWRWWALRRRPVPLWSLAPAPVVSPP